MTEQGSGDVHENSEKDFLHDLSNHLAISYGNIKLLSLKVGSDAGIPTAEKERILEKINKALVSFDKANALIEGRRNFIRLNT